MRLPSPPACTPSSRDRVWAPVTAATEHSRRPGLVPHRGPRLRKPRPRAARPQSWRRDRGNLPPADSAANGKPPRAGDYRPRPGPWRGGLDPWNSRTWSGERRAWERAAWLDLGVPLGGAVHQAASAPGRGAGVRPSGFWFHAAAGPRARAPPAPRRSKHILAPTLCRMLVLQTLLPTARSAASTLKPLP